MFLTSDSLKVRPSAVKRECRNARVVPLSQPRVRGRAQDAAGIGVGVARGYLNSADDRRSFALDPDSGLRRFATGDRGRLADIEPFQPRKVVVLGAGMMGAAIAYVCARAGLEVTPPATAANRTASSAIVKHRQRIPTAEAPIDPSPLLRTGHRALSRGLGGS